MKVSSCLTWIRRYKQKTYFQNFSRFQFYVYKLCLIVLCFIARLTTVLNSFSSSRPHANNCSHFVRTQFQLNSFGKMCYLAPRGELLSNSENFESLCHQCEISEHAFKTNFTKYSSTSWCYWLWPDLRSSQVMFTTGVIWCVICLCSIEVSYW